jgi:hypothetical protein
MDDEQQAGAVELDARLRGVPPSVTRRIWIGEQASLAGLHAVLPAAFGRSDEPISDRFSARKRPVSPKNPQSQAMSALDPLCQS